MDMISFSLYPFPKERIWGRQDWSSAAQNWNPAETSVYKFWTCPDISKSVCVLVYVMRGLFLFVSDIGMEFAFYTLIKYGVIL